MNAAAPPLQLVPATALQAELVATMHAACFELGWSAEDFAILLGHPGSFASLALRGDRPVGMVLARQAADEAEILTLAVLPEERRQGVAALLLARTLAAAKAAGCNMVFLEVATGNAAARRLYAGAGFGEIGRRRGYYEAQAGGSREDALVMRLDF
jgi:ribosomal-protein-alanine N-acetyltransferase